MEIAEFDSPLCWLLELSPADVASSVLLQVNLITVFVDCESPVLRWSLLLNFDDLDVILTIFVSGVVWHNHKIITQLLITSIVNCDICSTLNFFESLSYSYFGCILLALYLSRPSISSNDVFRAYFDVKLTP